MKWKFRTVVAGPPGAVTQTGSVPRGLGPSSVARFLACVMMSHAGAQFVLLLVVAGAAGVVLGEQLLAVAAPKADGTSPPPPPAAPAAAAVPAADSSDEQGGEWVPLAAVANANGHIAPVRVARWLPLTRRAMVHLTRMCLCSLAAFMCTRSALMRG